MHDLAGGLVLGYHGCDQAVGEALLSGAPFAKSSNPWDWLGHGVYFWEANPGRALDFADELSAKQYKRSRVKTPFVIGAAIKLGQ